jgi:hypothetical protein
MMGDQATARKVREAVEEWTPSEVMDHERKYQSELQEYLDERLNSGDDLMGGNKEYAVHTERGTSKGDVVVNDVVGIEMKRNFSNSQQKKLRGQLEDYSKNYPYVIGLACGVDDYDGWRELKNEYEGQDPMSMGMDATEFVFIAKERDTFGQSSPSSSGGMGGGGGLSLGGGGGGGNSGGNALDMDGDLFDADGEGEGELGPFGVAAVALIVAGFVAVQMPFSNLLFNIVVIAAAVLFGGFSAYRGVAQE